MNATAVAADQLMSCVANVVVVVLLPDEEWPTVVFSGTVGAHELKCRWRAAGGVEAIDRKEERWQGVDDGQGDRVGVDRVDDGHWTVSMGVHGRDSYILCSVFAQTLVCMIAGGIGDTSLKDLMHSVTIGWYRQATQC